MIAKIKKNLVNIPGWSTKRKLLIIESDDWGAITMSDKRAFDKLLVAGAPVDKSKYTKYDQIESEDDIDMICNAFASIKDCKGNPPKITANFIVANPDFDKIKLSDYQEYYFEDFRSTYQRYNNHARSFEKIQTAMQQNFIKPQLHGREHLNPTEWLNTIRNGSTYEKLAFDLQCLLAFSNPENTRRKLGYMAAFDYEKESEFETFEKILRDAASGFEAAFGFASKSFIAPTSTKSSRMDTYLNTIGVRYHQVGQQRLPIAEHPDKVINHLFGSTNQLQQIYLRRNVSFEPSNNIEKNIENQVLYEIDAAFRWGKPAVLSSHRVNYSGGLVEKNRENTINQLTAVLKKALAKHPEMEFVDTEQLGDLIAADKGIL